MDALEMYGVAKTMLFSFIKAGISSKDGIVHGIAMGFAPTQLADVMAFHMCMQPCLHVVPLMSSVLKMDP